MVRSGPLAHGRRRLDLAALEKGLRAVKAEWPEQSSLTLETEDAVAYEDLVAVMDVCIGAAFPGVSVLPAI